MLKVYGSDLCPDCTNFKKNLDHYHIEYEYIDINANLRDLKQFLKFRDADPAFDHTKEVHDIGIPALLKEDGTLSVDWIAYLKEAGFEPLENQDGSSCSLDHKSC